MTGDTDQFYWGAGTFASRGAVVAGNAVNEAAKWCGRKSSNSPPSISNAPRKTWRSPTAKFRWSACPARPVKLGDAGAEGQSDARRCEARHRAGTRIDPIFRPAQRRHRERCACHDRRGRSADLHSEGAQVCRGARLRHGHQSAHPCRPDPWRRRPRHRQCLLRTARVRRRRPIAQRLAGRLSPADGAWKCRTWRLPIR